MKYQQKSKMCHFPLIHLIVLYHYHQRQALLLYQLLAPTPINKHASVLPLSDLMSLPSTNAVVAHSTGEKPCQCQVRLFIGPKLKKVTEGKIWIHVRNSFEEII